MKPNRAMRRKSGAGAAIADRFRHAVALHEKGELKQAEKLYRQIIRKVPRHFDALHLLGVIAFQQRRFDRASRLIGDALRIDPDHPVALSNRGAALRQLNRPEEARACLERALSLDENLPEAMNNLGLLLRDGNRLREALVWFEKAVTQKPRYADAHWNRSLSHLALGNFREGWAEYAWRSELENPLVTDSARFHRAPLPADLAGRHLAIEREQGLGDEIFFLRFAPELRRRGARTTYLADRRIAAMLGRAGIVDRVLPANGDPGPYDFRLTVGDLPRLLGMDDANRPPASYAIPPLSEPESRLSGLLHRFGPPPFVGITWRAGGDLSGVREGPIEGLCEAVNRLGATPVVVQRLPREGELDRMRALTARPVLDLSVHNECLEDMLALMGLLDHYICVDNTNQHLRAARGRRSHVLVASPPEFRWQAAGDESPWFPGTRCYRQTPEGDWSPAFRALEADLAAIFRAPDAAPGIPGYA